jgi:hypothetical protein
MLYEHIEQEKSKECFVLGRTNIKRVPKLEVLAASHSWVKPVQRV